MVQYLVTTEDNPFDPFEQSDDWNRFDQDHGYNTNAYFARVIDMVFGGTNDMMTEKEEIELMNKAVDSIVDLNLTGNYKKVGKEIEVSG